MAEKKVKEIKTESSFAKATGDKKAADKKVAVTARTYDVLRRPIISEKSAKCAETNSLVFEIDARATKKDVANAVRAIYNVSPKSVNILNVRGKVKVSRVDRRPGTQKNVKKAYITLPKDAKIEIANV